MILFLLLIAVSSPGWVHAQSSPDIDRLRTAGVEFLLAFPKMQFDVEISASGYLEEEMQPEMLRFWIEPDHLNRGLGFERLRMLVQDADGNLMTEQGVFGHVVYQFKTGDAGIRYSPLGRFGALLWEEISGQHLLLYEALCVLQNRDRFQAAYDGRRKEGKEMVSAVLFSDAQSDQKLRVWISDTSFQIREVEALTMHCGDESTEDSGNALICTPEVERAFGVSTRVRRPSWFLCDAEGRLVEAGYGCLGEHTAKQIRAAYAAPLGH